METTEQNSPRATQKKIKRKNHSKPLWKIINLQRKAAKKEKKNGTSKQLENNEKQSISQFLPINN